MRVQGLASIIVLFFAWSAPGALSADGAPPLLRSIAETRALDHNTDSVCRVDFEGTVTYFDPVWSFSFVTDAGHSIFLHGIRSEHFVGQRVRVRGLASRGDLSPVVSVDSMEVLGTAELPDPVIVDAATLRVGEHDCDYVKLTGTVLNVVVGVPQSFLYCENDSNRFFVCVTDWSLGLEEAAKWVGQEMAATGCLGLQMSKYPFVDPGEPHAAIRCLKLFVKSTDLLEFNVPLPDHRLPRVSRIIRAQRITKQTFPFLTHGQISYVGSDFVTLFDAFDAVRIETASTQQLRRGAVVRVTGNGRRRGEEDGPGSLQMVADAFQLLEHLPVKPELAQSPTEASRDIKWYQRKCVTGNPVSYAVRDGFTYLELDDGESVVDVRIDPLAPSSNLAQQFEAGEVRSVSVTGVVVPVERPGAHAKFQLLVSNEDGTDVEVLRRRMPALKTIAWTIAGLAVTVGFCLLWVKTLRKEVSQRSQEAVSVSAQLRSTYEAIDDGILAIDVEGDTLAVNREMTRLLGVPLKIGDSAEVFSRRLSVLLKDNSHFRQIFETCESDPTHAVAFDLELKSDPPVYLDVRTAPVKSTVGGPSIGRLWVFRDQTEKRGLEAELIRSNRMEAVGRMASGVAHDFNNVLMAICANLSIAQLDKTSSIGAVTSKLRVAEEAAFRGADIVRRLLTFSRPQELEFAVVSVNEIVHRLEELVCHTFDASIKFEFELDPSAPRILAAGMAVEQVLLNLYVNAREAMTAGGKITTVTQRLPNSATGKEMVMISVTDTGVGMSEAVRERIFEPFYSTKTANGNSGVGLSVSYKVIQEHEGTMACLPTRHGGTEFQVMLPVHHADEVGTMPAREEYGAKLPQGDGATILVVEDEDVVRAVAQAMLRRNGFKTLAAADGSRALELLRENLDRIDAVLLDLTMPGISGREVLQEIKSTWPSLPVVLCSGYFAGDPTIGVIDEYVADEAIAKPYSMRDLLETVERAVAHRTATSSARI